MPIEMNQIEASRFGIIAAKVIDQNASIEAINAAAMAHKVQMLSIRVSTDELSRVQALEANGFRLMDTLVYYDRTLADLETSEDSLIRTATVADSAAVEKIARASFAGYFGHYHADPRLSNASADAVYVEWAANSVKVCCPQNPVYVAVEQDDIVGFITVRTNSECEAELVLAGVDPQQQGQGLYGRLFAFGMAASKKAGRNRIITSTQVNNVAVQRAWGRQGLRMARSYYTLHKWF